MHPAGDALHPPPLLLLYICDIAFKHVYALNICVYDGYYWLDFTLLDTKVIVRKCVEIEGESDCVLWGSYLDALLYVRWVRSVKVECIRTRCNQFK